MDVTGPPFSLDPLIAEAKRRARQRRLLVAGLAVLIAGAALGTTLMLRPPRGSGSANALAHAATRMPTLLVNGGPQGTYRWQVRPADAWILYTGDGSGRLGGTGGTGLVHPGHLKWESWTKTRATGSGAVWLDDQGTVRKDRVRVRAFRPINGHFTRLTLRYSDRGKEYIDTRSIGRNGSLWSYGIVKITARRSTAGR
jgi:hypothetical protein